jgi:serine/threonine protein kinase/lipopolysaccharide biosynthesis regulator YciM
MKPENLARPATAVNADGNLLFGLLAFQNNFIDRAALLGAFDEWVQDKGRPLGQILRERGALSDSRHALLEALVAEHIRHHGDDPEKSLAALSSIGTVREDLSRLADPELHASLVHVSAARPDDDPYRTVHGASLGAPSAIGARFRVLRPHARGGLGEVFLARDTELNRDVALKEIQDRYADDPRYRTRFEYEAEVTGGLEHPGIVPVYGLGHTADGRPFYAMRFIRGDSLKDAIRRFHQAESHPGRDPGQSALELRELLGRFVDVCDAVAYAHSRGVLHRDLKPGNIMLGRYGETLVVDWGLAKALEGPEEGPSATPEAEPRLRPSSGSAVEPTQAGSAVGTPGYMSPEQVDRRFGPLGVRSDVYCLGATLYHLLTGHAPCEAEQVGAIYQKILAGEVPRPRSLNPRLAPALEAICLKALALHPSERYATAEALKADVERWLADEPVAAWNEPFSIRAKRWMRRHRTLVAGLMTVLVLGSAGLAGFSAILAGKNRELDRQRRAAVDERNRAAKSESETRAVLDFFQDKILAATRPEGQEGGLGKEVTIRRAVDAAEPQIAEAFRDQPVVEASIRDTLGSTYLFLGEPELAIRQKERCRQLRRQVHGPDHPDTLVAMNNLAVAYQDAGRLEDARRLLEEALEVMKAKLGPDHESTLSCMNNLASVYTSFGQLGRAIALHEQAVETRRVRLGADHPDSLSSMNNLALAYNRAGQLDRAIALEEQTVELRRVTLGADHPATLLSMNNLAISYDHAGQLDRAIALHEQSLSAQRTKLGEDHPDTLRSMNNLAVAYKHAGQFDRAIPLYEQALKVQQGKLGSDHPDTLLTLDNLSAAYASAGQPDRAITLGEQALAAYRAKLGEQHTDTLISQSNLAANYQKVGRLQDAELLYRKTVEGFRRQNPRNDRYYSHSLVMLGHCLIRQRKFEEAGQFLRTSLEIKEKTQPDDWTTAQARSLLGEALTGQKAFEAAESLLLNAQKALTEQRDKIRPADRDRTLRNAAECLVRLYEAWGKPDKAAEWRQKLGENPLDRGFPADPFVR